MGVLMWDKPKKVKSTEEWREGYGFEGGPSGGYIPNMSEDDERRWKAKITGVKLGFPQVEIRKTARQAQMTIIVSLGAGYNYKHYRAVREPNDPLSGWGTTEGINVHISLNGPAQMTFQEVTEMNLAIEEAKAKLEELKGT